MTEKRQEAIARLEVFIRDFIAEHHYSPTTRECCKGIGVKSTSTVHGYLQTMRNDGIIAFDNAKPRTIRLLK